LVEDLTRGKIPNVPKEMGVPAEWKHNKPGLVKKVAVAAVIGGAVYALTRRSSSSASKDTDGEDSSADD
jgi:hypothetical protein